MYKIGDIVRIYCKDANDSDRFIIIDITESYVILQVDDESQYGVTTNLYDDNDTEGFVSFRKDSFKAVKLEDSEW